MMIGRKRVKQTGSFGRTVKHILFCQVWCGCGCSVLQCLAGAAVCVLRSKKLAEDCVLAEEKRGRLPVDDKEKDLGSRYEEEG